MRHLGKRYPKHTKWLDTPEGQQAAERRAKNFDVRVEAVKDPSVEDEFRVEITHNGSQWHGLTMSPRESMAVIQAIRKHLST